MDSLSVLKKKTKKNNNKIVKKKIRMSHELETILYVSRTSQVLNTNGIQSSMDARSILFKRKGRTFSRHYHAECLHTNISKRLGTLQHTVSFHLDASFSSSSLAATPGVYKNLRKLDQFFENSRLKKNVQCLLNRKKIYVLD